MSNNYILIGQTPVMEPDIVKWAQWFEKADRRVARTQVGKCEVSTVFLGTDNNFSGHGPPLLFETMVFPEAQICWRCATWLEAEAQHKRAVREIGHVTRSRRLSRNR